MGIYIKGFKPKDGLYVIKDRVIRKYKGNGGTVRPYELVEVKEPRCYLDGFMRRRAMSDTISKQDAIDELERIFDRCEEIEAHLPEGDPDRVGYKMYPDWFKVWNYIFQLPSAQPERKKGKWILTEDDNYEYCTCSECGYQNGENWMNGSDIPFCAVCGADMRGDTE